MLFRSTIGFVCEKLGLNGLSFSAAQRATDKFKMKQAFRNCGVSSADFRAVYSLDEAKNAAGELGYPCILKPADSSGSRGVRKVSHAAELPASYEEAYQHTRLPYVLMEQFIDAQEIGVDAFIENGQVKVFLPHTKLTYTTPNGVTIPLGHCFPYHAEHDVLKNIYKQICLSADALGLDHCSLNADVFVRGSQVWIIEIGARSGATCIPELITINQGYDWYELLIRSALGESVTFSQKEEIPCMSCLLFCPENEVITGIERDVLSTLPADVRFQIDYPVGSAISAAQNGTDRLGHVIVPTDRLSYLRSCVLQVSRSIRLRQGTLDEVCAKSGIDFLP